MNSSTAKASSTGLGWQTLLSRKDALLPFAGFLAVVAGLTYLQFVARAPAVTYGAPDKTFFAKKTVTPGEETALCFDAVTWHRLCPGNLITWLEPANVADLRARRIDLESHPISTPAQLGAVAPKCRPFKTPLAAAPGIWKLRGEARLSCSPFTVTTDLPGTALIVQAK